MHSIDILLGVTLCVPQTKTEVRINCLSPSERASSSVGPIFNLRIWICPYPTHETALPPYLTLFK